MSDMIVKVALDIPSGKLICANDLREEFSLNNDDEFNVNETVGIKRIIEAYGNVGMFYGFCGNSCPGLYLDGNKLSIVSPAYDENDDSIDPNLGTQVGSIITDLWWYSIADHDNFISRGGKVDKRWNSIVNVEPGRYILSHNLDIERDYKKLEIYATIEKSDEKIIPWKMPEEDAVKEIMKVLPAKYLVKEIVNVEPIEGYDVETWNKLGYNKDTKLTSLYVETAYKRPPDNDYTTPWKKIGYKLWGRMFDGEENIYIRHVIVDESQIQDYQYLADKAVESFELEKKEQIEISEAQKLWDALPTKVGKKGYKVIDQDILTDKQKADKERYSELLHKRVERSLEV